MDALNMNRLGQRSHFDTKDQLRQRNDATRQVRDSLGQRDFERGINLELQHMTGLSIGIGWIHAGEVIDATIDRPLPAHVSNLQI